MTLTPLGWVVVHSIWQGLVIAGLTALALGFIREPRAQTRYVIACVSLALMAIVPLATMFAGMNATRLRMRPATFAAVESVISYPSLIWWGSVIVPVLGACWLGGVTVCLVRISREVRRARSLRRDELGDPGADVCAVVAQLRAVAPGGAADVRSSSRAAVPMVLGWRRPVILLPDGTTDRLRPSQLRAILAHELAHVRRSDYLVNLIQMAVETMLFHHPAARWVSRIIRAEREYCCDDAAVRVSGDAGDYARALAALEDARADCRLAVAAGSGTLLDRIQRIVGHPRQVMTPLRGVAVLMVTSVVAAAILAAALLVPPSLPFGTVIRPRRPPPNGIVPAGSVPAPDGELKQRTPGR